MACQVAGLHRRCARLRITADPTKLLLQETLRSLSIEEYARLPCCLALFLSYLDTICHTVIVQFRSDLQPGVI